MLTKAGRLGFGFSGVKQHDKDGALAPRSPVPPGPSGP